MAFAQAGPDDVARARVGGNGLEVEVGSGTLTLSPRDAPPRRTGKAFAAPVVGARVSYVRYEYTFNNQAAFTGNASPSIVPSAA